MNFKSCKQVNEWINGNCTLYGQENHRIAKKKICELEKIVVSGRESSD